MLQLVSSSSLYCLMLSALTALQRRQLRLREHSVSPLSKSLIESEDQTIDLLTSSSSFTSEATGLACPRPSWCRPAEDWASYWSVFERKLTPRQTWLEVIDFAHRRPRSQSPSPRCSLPPLSLIPPDFLIHDNRGSARRKSNSLQNASRQRLESYRFYCCSGLASSPVEKY